MVWIKRNSFIVYLYISNRLCRFSISSVDCNFAQKKFYFPFPNYATRKALFEHYMEKNGAKLPDNFPVTTIAHVT